MGWCYATSIYTCILYFLWFYVHVLFMLCLLVSSYGPLLMNFNVNVLSLATTPAYHMVFLQFLIITVLHVRYTNNDEKLLDMINGCPAIILFTTIVGKSRRSQSYLIVSANQVHLIANSHLGATANPASSKYILAYLDCLTHFYVGRSRFTLSILCAIVQACSIASPSNL